MGTYGNLWELMGTYGNFMRGNLWEPTGACGNLWELMGIFVHVFLALQGVFSLCVFTARCFFTACFCCKTFFHCVFRCVFCAVKNALQHKILNEKTPCSVKYTTKERLATQNTQRKNALQCKIHNRKNALQQKNTVKKRLAAETRSEKTPCSENTQ